ncbi:hypothetical protein SESBI_27806 [Sesbania bispinosa]|nr:hypothetical protein SESBI_27806 [Sesbania bispinosa]
MNQQTTVLSTLLGEGRSTLPSGQAAPVTSRLDHLADEFLAFWQCHPSIFEGGVGHASAANWLKRIEETMNSRGYPDEQRVSFASLILRGEAEIWWRGIRDRVMALDTPITWEAFRTPFLERYYPILQGRKRDVSPLEGSSGGSVMDERVAQQLGRQVAACAKCGKGHRGACFLGLGRCFYYHQPGHIARDFPRRRNKKAEVQISTFWGNGRS